ncbi:MAG: hypothetical protein N2Z21_01800 [Candidatus Sumerlaeaceae bacterium]|nr:hypothetical protein [Candidatus Sumerlaeaceae bacterium]
MKTRKTMFRELPRTCLPQQLSHLQMSASRYWANLVIAVWLLAAFVVSGHVLAQQLAPNQISEKRETNSPTSTPTSDEYELKANGISPTPESCLRLLRDGLPATVDPQKLSPTPPEKTQLAVDAMAIIAKARFQSASETLLSIAQQDLPKGVQQLMEIDMKATSPEHRELFRARATEILQYNAINALGFLGDKRALPVVISVFEAETRIAPKIQHALTLASLGDARGIDFLVQVINLQNRRESVAAAKAFALITGEDLGYTEQTPVKKRRQIARAYQQWWHENKNSFRLEPKTVIARRLAPEPSPTYEPRTTRDLLRLSSQYFDLENKPRVIAARERLAAAGPALNPDLERYMFDEMEDLNVRLEAMNWYYEINRERAKDAFKRLRKDANPEVADKAAALMEKIDKPDAGGVIIPGQRGN